MLYLFVGDAVRSKYRSASKTAVEESLKLTDPLPDPWVKTWARRSRALLAAPETFEYDAWCGHGLARTPIDG